ncbi:adenylate/guanylate cyclase domain-containing protein [Nocardioides hankookensis]|uniref:Adenylate/guanylate cyclase domain-containing protein n=1 Tax=Nocardioides hankookensis TaxID=443157 RepID=A0ABW1LNP4_9ACTN
MGHPEAVTSCGGCGASGQPAGARFCHACGSTLTAVTCPTCHAEVVPGARFCSTCGGALGAVVAAPSQPVASRRITSVLFGDLVGFTALAETRDQEQVRELLSRYFDECRAIVARYGGTIEKFIGDAVMAVWGVPTAHEDDAERAVRAGLELVNTIAAMGSDIDVPDLAMRVGIVTGEVAVTIGAEHQGMVAGDAVNTASRVQSAAAPGQVWVDETTRLLTSSAITYLDVGSHAMKGKAEPVPLWSVRAVVAAVGGAQRADGLEGPLVGRDREMRVIKELFHGIEQTRRPALLVVDGEAGVGKSRLAWEFEKYVDGLSADVRWHTGRCLSYGEGVAFYALAEAIRARLQVVVHGDTGAAGDEDQTRLIAAGLDLLVEDPDERAWLEPRIAALLGVGAVGSFGREDLFAAWTAFLARVGGDGTPVALLVDDAQHADDGLLHFVEHLLAVGEFPCFVVLLTRPGLIEENPALATNRRATVVHLEPLGPPEMGQLLDGLVAGLDDHVRSSLVQRAEGIPLFAVETVRSLIDRDLVVPRGGQYVLAGDGPLDLDAVGAPASLQALVAARLDKLLPDQRRVVDRASVIGRGFALETIADLCPDVADVDAVLASLVRLQLLRQESNRLSSELGLYHFVQAVVRQVAYGTLARRDRKAGHLAVVALLAGEDDASGEVAAIEAQHHLEAIDAVPEDADVPELTARAIVLLRLAAARAAALGAPLEAASHLRVALDRAADPMLRASIELELARVLRDTADIEGCIRHAESAKQAFEAAGDELSTAAAVAQLAYGIGTGRHDYETSIAMAEERYDALRGRLDAVPVLLELLKVLTGLKLRTSSSLGDVAEERARLAEVVGSPDEVADSYNGLALHHMLTGTRGIGRIIFEAAAEISRRHHLPAALTRSLVNLNVSWTPDDASRAVEFGREALVVGRQSGSVYAHSSAGSNLALAALVSGEWDEALSAADEAVMDVPLAELVRARISLARGIDWRPGLGVSPEDTGDDLSLRCFVEIVGALDAHQAGRPSAALARQAAETAYAVTELYDDFSIIWLVGTELAWAAGDRDELTRMLAIVDDHRGSNEPIGVGAQRARLAGLLAAEAGDDATAEEQLRRALRLASTWRAEPTAAQCRVELAALLQRQGRSTEAEEEAALARVTFERLGATAWLESLSGAATPGR